MGAKVNRRAAPDWLTQWDYAHRGLHSEGVPENSLAAAEGAITRRFGIECDIQRSRDGIAMVFHDWELDRLTDQTGLVEHYDAADLEQMTLLGTDQTPIRLSRFLERISDLVPVLIEIKSRPDYDVERSCEVVARDIGEAHENVAVMSFDPRVPEWFARYHPVICRGLVGTDSLPNGFEHVWRVPDVLKQAQPDFLAVDRRDLSQPEAAQWRASGKPLLSWTVRSLEERDDAEELADALIVEGEAAA